jgi:hypothetical protein
MIYFESYQVFLVNSLAVPRLGNVRLRFTLPAATLQKGVYIVSLIDSEGKLFTTKLQR